MPDDNVIRLTHEGIAYAASLIQRCDALASVAVEAGLCVFTGDGTDTLALTEQGFLMGEFLLVLAEPMLNRYRTWNEDIFVLLVQAWEDAIENPADGDEDAFQRERYMEDDDG